nr:hypothetical protein GOBAR_DD05469 [Ipomoea batatas]GME09153.1 hypothetical protein GOBAR_DD05469 [Ipomoea batatas]
MWYKDEKEEGRKRRRKRRDKVHLSAQHYPPSSACRPSASKLCPFVDCIVCPAASSSSSPPLEGTEASFSLPAAISLVMSFPSTWDKSRSILSASQSAPTDERMCLRSSAEGQALHPRRPTSTLNARAKP